MTDAGIAKLRAGPSNPISARTHAHRRSIHREFSMRMSITRSSAVRQSLALVIALSACADTPTAPTKSPLSPLADRESRRLRCDPDNGGITLPSGFCAVVVADIVIDGAPARARHMAVTPSGDVFVAINSPGNNNPSFGIVGLRDKDGDGRADEQTLFSPGLGGSGMAWRDGPSYFAGNGCVLSFRLPDGQLHPTGPPTRAAPGLPNNGDDISKTVVLAAH